MQCFKVFCKPINFPSCVFFFILTIFPAAEMKLYLNPKLRAWEFLPCISWFYGISPDFWRYFLLIFLWCCFLILVTYLKFYLHLPKCFWRKLNTNVPNLKLAVIKKCSQTINTFQSKYPDKRKHFEISKTIKINTKTNTKKNTNESQPDFCKIHLIVAWANQSTTLNCLNPRPRTFALAVNCRLNLTFNPVSILY